MRTKELTKALCFHRGGMALLAFCETVKTMHISRCMDIESAGLCHIGMAEIVTTKYDRICLNTNKSDMI